MTENKILKLEFSARSEAAGKLTEQQSECLGHEAQTNLQPIESYEIQWNLGLRKPQVSEKSHTVRIRLLSQDQI